jgi:hypothetical protein
MQMHFGDRFRFRSAPKQGFQVSRKCFLFFCLVFFLLQYVTEEIKQSAS